MNAKRSEAGFTLVELMVSVAIVGIIASVAAPTFTQLTLRSKAAERHEVMLRVKKAVADYYVQHGNTYLADGVTQLAGTPQPATLGAYRRMPDYKDPTDGWVEIFRTSQEIDGALYYQYSFVTDDSVNPPTLLITATGDLDGDGIPNTWWTKYSRIDGAYIVVNPLVDEHRDPDDVF